MIEENNMNWYKEEQRRVKEWDQIWRELKEKLNREPTYEEVKEQFYSNLFEEKKEPWHDVVMAGHKWKDKLPGGKADKKSPSDFDPEQLKKGIEVEMEHTTDPEKAKEMFNKYKDE